LVGEMRKEELEVFFLLIVVGSEFIGVKRKKNREK